MAYTQGLLLDPKILTEDQVLALYNKCFSLLMEGKTIIHWAGEGAEVTKQFPIPIEDMMAECRYCLRQINPTTYGHNVTQVKPFFV